MLIELKIWYSGVARIVVTMKQSPEFSPGYSFWISGHVTPRPHDSLTLSFGNKLKIYTLCHAIINKYLSKLLRHQQINLDVILRHGYKIYQSVTYKPRNKFTFFYNLSNIKRQYSNDSMHKVPPKILSSAIWWHIFVRCLKSTDNMFVLFFRL